MDAVKKAILGEVLEEEEAYEVMRALMAGEVSRCGRRGFWWP